MNKKIMVLSASPNKDGNTSTVVEWFSQGAQQAGARVEVITVAGLRYKTNGCIACMGCQKSTVFECTVKDDAAPIIARMPDNDVLVFATPLYFFGPSAQLKLIVDRMYSLFKFNYETGEIRHHLRHATFGLIATAGADQFSALEQTFRLACGFMNNRLESLLIPFAGPSGGIKTNADAQARAIAFGRKLAEWPHGKAYEGIDLLYPL